MPYIENDGRGLLIPRAADAITPGELNYQVSYLVNKYLNKHGLSYGSINEVIGVLECAKLECYARVARPYEEKKINLNGDIYSPELVGREV